jgi:hypothetical protein
MHAAQVSVNRDTDDDVIMPGVGQEAGMVKRERIRYVCDMPRMRTERLCNLGRE